MIHSECQEKKGGNPNSLPKFWEYPKNLSFHLSLISLSRNVPNEKPLDCLYFRNKNVTYLETIFYFLSTKRDLQKHWQSQHILNSLKKPLLKQKPLLE
jgi:hypothetical protein